MPVISEWWMLFALMHPADEAAGPAAALHTWSVEPGVVLPLVASAVLYVCGVGAPGARRCRAGNSSVAGGGVHRRLAGGSRGAHIAGRRDERELFSMHMVQHELLMIVAAPLLVFGSPCWRFCGLPVRRARPRRCAHCGCGVARLWTRSPRRRRVAAARHRAVALAPAGALRRGDRSEAMHALEHACFFVSAGLFWWGITRGRYGRWLRAAVLYVFATAMHSGLLGAAMTLSPRVWYPAYAATTAAWGLYPIEDQQLAGLIMWIPAGLVFIAWGSDYFASG